MPRRGGNSFFIKFWTLYQRPIEPDDAGRSCLKGFDIRLIVT
jgi:hypothetical protein